MPKRRRTKTASRSTAITKRVGPSTINVRVPAPIQRAARHQRRSASAHEKTGGSPFEYALAGAALGFLDKVAKDKGWPTMPVIGRTGTIGLAAYFMRKHSPYLGKIARAGFTVAGYQYLRSGTVEGDDDMRTIGGMFATV